MGIDAAREPSFWSAQLWRRALLIASLRDERTDPFAAAEAWLLWEIGVWHPPQPPTEQDHADHRPGQARS